MNNFLSQILSRIGEGAQSTGDYFKAPSNPYDFKSPIRNDDLVTRNLPPGVQSPIPQEQVLQHVQGGSAFQNTMDQGRNNIDQWVKAFNPSVPRPISQPIPQPTAPVMPTATPTPAIGNFNDFITVSQQQIPLDYKNLITASATANNIPPALLASLLFTEHGFSRDPGWHQNKNGSWDRGPAQINSSAHPEVSDAQALDPKFAIPWAARTLAGHIKNLGIHRGIVAYNAGATGSGRIQDLRNHPYYVKIAKGLSEPLKRSLGL